MPGGAEASDAPVSPCRPRAAYVCTSVAVWNGPRRWSSQTRPISGDNHLLSETGFLDEMQNWILRVPGVDCTADYVAGRKGRHHVRHSGIGGGDVAGAVTAVGSAAAGDGIVDAATAAAAEREADP